MFLSPARRAGGTRVHPEPLRVGWSRDPDTRPHTEMTEKPGQELRASPTGNVN
jgi:hypothetical protein